MSLLHVNPRDPLPLYAQLERGIRLAIATGKIKLGEQLPTVRQLAVDLKVNANTIARVYAELESEGVLITKRGVGTFIHGDRTPAKQLPRAERNQLLRTLTERFLQEATAHGFTARDVIQQFKRLSPDSKEKSHGK